MKDMLAGKTALITGGTSGIGEATVELFVEEGANVVFTGRDEEKGANVQERCGGNALFFKANVLHEEQIKAAVDYTVEMFERIDILFNNAGAPVEGGIENMTSEKLHYATDLLVGSVMHATKYAVPHMKKHGFGRIINNSSVAAHGTHYGRYIYSAAKAAVSHLTREWREWNWAATALRSMRFLRVQLYPLFLSAIHCPPKVLRPSIIKPN